MPKPEERKPRTDAEDPVPVLVESMNLWDVDEVLLIENQSFPTPWPGWAFVQDLRSSRSICLVARIAGELAGYAVAWLLRSEMHIGNLAVAEAFRKKGVGARLLRELLGAARRRGMRTVTLEVRASNSAAIRLYRKFGFTAIAIKPGYYRCEGEDALVMAYREA